MLNIGVIGYGYWGPNIVRNLNAIEGARVVAVCDRDQGALKRLSGAYKQLKICSQSDEILNDTTIDIVAVVTPVCTHFELAKKALENGKHVFVEKPFTSSSAQAVELIELAEKKNLKIMVDHTFIFTGAVRKIKDLLAQGELGDIYYYDSVRVNLGLFQHDVNVVWDLAPHDFSIMRYLINEKPLALSAWGRSHINKLEDIAYVTVHFGSSKLAHFSLNWLSPVKVRTTLIGGEKKMLVWNDVNPDEKIKIYDKGVEVKNAQGIYDLLVSYRSGDMWAPKVQQTEALKLECQHFIQCIEQDSTPLNDGVVGLEVVQMLEACNESIKNGGRMVQIGSDVLSVTG
ncbi:Gfo/Idh/MocA family oxidoreductase [Chitinispirillales bacterium ANBcel5]|uniref:Gfo/Idh/MocA family protein n=1 Tax=Cellulosispirillum alkaliphilum TaxID=3039283 RepID=UPI002A531DD9|nr:Gfo/Idh/MocA family oxidoreductase [Chitinispirillales bacterium ANBcel5]